MGTPSFLTASARDWTPSRLLDAFILVNVAFLALDIYLAHSVNDFEHPAEWTPFGYSLAAPVVMIVAFVLGRRDRRTSDRLLRIVGWGGVIIGVSGMVFHLGSHFFAAQTLVSLVYAAPFAAPLAYTGLGLLTIMSRMVAPGEREWGQWVLLLAAGGFAGNFVLGLTDHAQNGFFHFTEWIPVISSAFAITVLLMACRTRVEPGYIRLSAVVMLVQIIVGLLGFWCHGRANLAAAGDNVKDAFVYGAPVFAPLLFPDLALLGMLGLWAVARRGADEA
ncbi:MAG: hypothetical protein C4547_04470 [Phycisphaerales bacterium]|nr:MAG: hypothetical protein C4547_04470 [Phycisphaerales bacterium]